MLSHDDKCKLFYWIYVNPFFTEAVGRVLQLLMGSTHWNTSQIPCKRWGFLQKVRDFQTFFLLQHHVRWQKAFYLGLALRKNAFSERNEEWKKTDLNPCLSLLFGYFLFRVCKLQGVVMQISSTCYSSNCQIKKSSASSYTVKDETERTRKFCLDGIFYTWMPLSIPEHEVIRLFDFRQVLMKNEPTLKISAF